jgi:hypothetical protein
MFSLPSFPLPRNQVHGQLQLSLGSYSDAVDMFQRVCYFDKTFGCYQPSVTTRVEILLLNLLS